MTWTLAGLEGIIRSSWGADTCPPDAHNPAWDPANPARGQCGVTALVVHDLLGGELVRAEVHVAGERVDFHWWNVLPGGVEIDLTRDQFGPEEIVTAATALARPTAPMKRGREEYLTLAVGSSRRSDAMAQSRPQRARPLALTGRRDGEGRAGGR